MSGISPIQSGRYIHASAVVLGHRGVLIRGVSRAGKSTLADQLVAYVSGQGGFAALVGDDRIALERAGTQVVMRGHPAIAGLIERRGVGIETMPFVENAVLQLVVDLSGSASMLQTRESPAILDVMGMPIPHLTFDRSIPQAEQVAMILAQLEK